MNLRDRVVGVDLDGTLCHGICWTPEECLAAKPNKKMVDWVAEKYKDSFIVIYTARKEELYPATREWLRRNNIRFHAYSDNKTPLDALIDDTVIHPKEIT